MNIINPLRSPVTSGNTVLAYAMRSGLMSVSATRDKSILDTIDYFNIYPCSFRGCLKD